MRATICWGLVIFFAALTVGPLAASPDFPAGAKALETKLLAGQPPDALAWIKDEASREASARFLSDETARNAARKFGASGSDVSTLSFLTLMQAARDADANVSELVSGVQSAAASRQDVRQQQMQQSGIAGSRQAQMSGGQQTAAQAEGSTFLSLLPSDDGKDNNLLKPATPAPDPAQEQTMNLQDAMDRESQIDDLLASAMKNVSQ